MNVLDTIKNLRDELNQHNYSYYVLDKPTISDFEFDQKLKQLQDLEANSTEHGTHYDFIPLIQAYQTCINEWSLNLSKLSNNWYHISSN